jgi:hypothetical protein
MSTSDVLRVTISSYQNATLLSTINFNDSYGNLDSYPVYNLSGMILSKLAGTIVTSSMTSGYFGIYIAPVFTLTLKYYT